MNLSDAIMTVDNRFQYKTDKNLLIDSWSVMKDKNGIFYGDCEDFSLTVFWYLSGQNIMKFLFNLLTQKYKLVWSKTINNELHFYGKYDGLCFDNWTKQALPESTFLNQTGHKKIMIFPMILGIPQLINGWIKR